MLKYAGIIPEIDPFLSSAQFSGSGAIREAPYNDS
jgi:hypothetical protein